MKIYKLEKQLQIGKQSKKSERHIKLQFDQDEKVGMIDNKLL